MMSAWSLTETKPMPFQRKDLYMFSFYHLLILPIQDTVTYDTYILEHTGATDPSATYTYTWEIGDVWHHHRQADRSQISCPGYRLPGKTYRTDNFGCTDSKEASIYVFSELEVQNVFTPNGDNRE